MIYVLFGPPGVGKTYIGGLIEKRKNIKFFDADTIYLNDDELRYLLSSGKYDQEVRDRFVDKLIKTVQHLLSENKNTDLIVAEAFTKEKNRRDFMKYFDNQVTYIMVGASKVTALQRMRARVKKEDHVVDEKVFEFIWHEFESPKIPHKVLKNINKSDQEITDEFLSLVE